MIGIEGAFDAAGQIGNLEWLAQHRIQSDDFFHRLHVGITGCMMIGRCG